MDKTSGDLKGILKRKNRDLEEKHTKPSKSNINHGPHPQINTILPLLYGSIKTPDCVLAGGLF